MNSYSEKTNLYETMSLIRIVENSLLDLFSKGLLNGTTHTSIGQEACSVGVINNLDPKKDIVFSNHRCHGHYLAYSKDAKGLLAEIMGKKSGLCGGIGGSQHIHKNNFYSNGIQGGIVPTATGMAFAEKAKRSNSIVACFIGDGTMGQGVVYESLNMASLWSLPIIYILENNYYAQTTPVKIAHAGKFVDRAKAFDIEHTEIEGFNVLEINEYAANIVDKVRKNCRPHFFVLNTYRFGPHSKGDDHRPIDEINNFKQKDPLNILKKHLKTDDITEIEERVEKEIEGIIEHLKHEDSQTLQQFLTNVGGRNYG